MTRRSPIAAEIVDSVVPMAASPGVAPARTFRSGKPVPANYRMCGAKTPNGPCEGFAMRNGRCRIHGGATPTGVMSATYIDGRSSRRARDLPQRLVERFQEAIGDPDLLSMTAEIATLDARLGDLLRSVESGESATLWRQLRVTWDNALRAQRAGDQANATLLLNEVDDLIRRGSADYAAWSEVRDVIQERRRLAESERQRLKDAQQTLTLAEAMSLIATLQESITRNVKDEGALAAIRQDLIRVANYKVS